MSVINSFVSIFFFFRLINLGFIETYRQAYKNCSNASFNFIRYKIGQNHLTEFIGMEPSKKRKRRTSFTPQALELLNHHFERNTHPSGIDDFTFSLGEVLGGKSIV